MVPPKIIVYIPVICGSAHILFSLDVSDVPIKKAKKIDELRLAAIMDFSSSTVNPACTIFSWSVVEFVSDMLI